MTTNVMENATESAMEYAMKNAIPCDAERTYTDLRGV